jgi:hypothetical protein
VTRLKPALEGEERAARVEWSDPVEIYAIANGVSLGLIEVVEVRFRSKM